jgi:hypothetical protein
MMSSMFVLHINNFLADQIKEEEMDGACGTYGADEIPIEDSGGET